MEIVRTEGKRREKSRDENTTPPGDGATTRVLGGLVRQAHLDLYANDIGTVGRGRLQASWCGQASRLLF